MLIILRPRLSVDDGLLLACETCLVTALRVRGTRANVSISQNIIFKITWYLTAYFHNTATAALHCVCEFVRVYVHEHAHHHCTIEL